MKILELQSPETEVKRHNLGAQQQSWPGRRNQQTWGQIDKDHAIRTRKQNSENWTRPQRHTGQQSVHKYVACTHEERRGEGEGNSQRHDGWRLQIWRKYQSARPSSLTNSKKDNAKGSTPSHIIVNLLNAKGETLEISKRRTSLAVQW